MLLVQSVPDSKLQERKLVEDAVAAFFAKGGKVENKAITERTQAEHPLADKNRKRAGAKHADDAAAKVKQHSTAILKLHKQGYGLTRIGSKLGITSLLIIKRAIFDAGECPAAHSPKAVTRQQIIELMRMAEGGSTPADAARWAGVSLAQAHGAARDYGFKFGKQ